GSQVGEVLLEDCKTIGADLLVMGAYTHSRMRQLILGGVTKHVLANAELPVLMAH
ncbi:MAG: universal stress protein, partial [Rhodospirillales bacterium]|nr:universal stress protein [Rhodospirillales bacterium]